ncbi:hypothetical protein Xen7305DRAFT_00028300 [Xenococcus sp. PCC 7305]|nr:hypothetical protein Xen7305DRAFT_00028300 [Xenococcus sp. PCC 7305]
MIEDCRFDMSESTQESCEGYSDLLGQGEWGTRKNKRKIFIRRIIGYKSCLKQNAIAMYTKTLRILIFYLIIFSSPTLLDLIFPRVATILELSLIVLLWGYTWIFVRGKLNKKEQKTPDFFLILLGICSLISVIISLFIREIPLAVIIYRLFTYFSFYTCVYLFAYIKRKYKLFKKLLIFIVLLSNIISIGIVSDSLGILVDVPIVGQRLVKWEEKAGVLQNKLRGGQRRGSFFIGGSTSVYPILSLGILSSVILFNLEGEKRKYLWGMILNLSLVWLGCFFSLSRAPVLLASAMIGYLVLRFFLLSRKSKSQRKMLIGIFCVIAIITAPILQAKLYEKINTKALNILSSGLSTEELANYKRYYAWYQGILLFTDSESYIGYGLGTSNVAVKKNKLLRYDQYNYHYESAIFSTFSEGGIVGLIVILLPFFIIIFYSQKTPNRDVYIIWVFLLVINLCAAPIYGYPSQLAYFVGMSFCLATKPHKSSTRMIVMKPMVSIEH